MCSWSVAATTSLSGIQYGWIYLRRPSPPARIVGGITHFPSEKSFKGKHNWQSLELMWSCKDTTSMQEVCAPLLSDANMAWQSHPKLYIIWSLVKKKDSGFFPLENWQVKDWIRDYYTYFQGIMHIFWKFAHQQLVVPVKTEMVTDMRTALVIVYRVTKNWQKVSSLSGGHLIQF